MLTFEHFFVTRSEDSISIPSVSIPTDRQIVLYSRRLSLASLLLSAIAGSARFDGELRRFARLSFPIGQTDFFRSDLTLKSNIEYACDAHDSDFTLLYSAVCCFPGLDHMMERRFGNLPRFVQLKLSYALGYSVGFDCLMFDGPVVIGDEPFKVACRSALQRHTGGFITATDIPINASTLGNAGILLSSDRVEFYDTLPMLQKATGRL